MVNNRPSSYELYGLGKYYSLISAALFIDATWTFRLYELCLSRGACHDKWVTTRCFKSKVKNIGSVLSGERSWYIHEFENSLLCLEYIMWGCEFPESSKNN